MVVVVLLIYIAGPSIFGGDTTVKEESGGSSTVSFVVDGCPRLCNSARKRFCAHRLTYICIRETRRAQSRGHRKTIIVINPLGKWQP